MLGEVVNGSVLVNNGKLGMIMATRWAAGALTGNSASMIMIMGKAASAWLGTPAIAADFGADITLTGVGVTYGSTLSMVMLASSGALSGVWDITGGLGMVIASGAVNNWTLGVANRLTAVSMLMLGDIANATAIVNGKLGMVMATRWATGGITASSMSMLMLMGKTANAWAGTPAVAADCGIDITLSGAGVTYGSTLGMVMLASSGTLSGVWDITGALGMVIASGAVNGWTLGVADRLTAVSMLMLGEVLNATATVNGKLGMVMATRWAAGAIAAHALSMIMVQGKAANAWAGTPAIDGDLNVNITLSGVGVTYGSTFGMAMISGGITGAVWDITGALGMLMVTGTVRNTTIRTTESLGMAMIGGADGSDFLAGMARNGKRHGTLVGDYANGEAKIGMFMVQGVGGYGSVTRAFVNSSLSAAAIGMVMMVNPEWDNGADGVNAGDEFGLFARDEISMVMITDRADATRTMTLMGYAGWTDTTVDDFHADTLI